MMVPSSACASASASADLPLAVGPAMSASGGLSEELMFIATLIAKERLARGDISAAGDALRTIGGEARGWAWVEQEKAGDLRLGQAPAGARAALEAALPAIDVVVQAEAGRRKRLLVADMDSTMIGVECIDELADYAGLRSQVSAVTEQAMRGEVDFAQALAARVALLKGLDARVIDHCHEQRVRITPGATALVRTMSANGAYCLLVSGGFSRFADRVAADIGFDAAISNRLLIDQGRIAGTVADPVVGPEGKKQALLDAAAARQVPLGETLAVGDGANDIFMLKAAGLGVAYHAKPAVAAAADARIDANDLTALLYLQGYPSRDWVE
jgi:phosphoserine phosphatase